MNYDEILKYYANAGIANPMLYRPDQMARDLGFSGTARTQTGWGGSPSESTGQGTEAIYDLTPDFEQFLKGYSYEPATSGGRNAALDIRNQSGQMVQDDYRVGDHKGTAMKIAGAVIPALVAGGFGAGIGGALGYGPMAASSGGSGALGIPGASYALPGAEGGFSLANVGAAAEGGIGAATGVDALASGVTQAGVNSAALGASGNLLAGAAGAASGIPWGELGKAAIGPLLSTGTQMYGANQAAGAMRDATNQANQLNAPAVAARNSALVDMRKLLDDPSSFVKTTTGQFEFDNGLKALNSGAAARGMSQSGGADKARIGYGINFTNSKIGESFNRLSQLASGGQSGASQTADNITSQGNANAMPWVIGSNAVADGINGLTAYGQRKNWWGG